MDTMDTEAGVLANHSLVGSTMGTMVIDMVSMDTMETGYLSGGHGKFFRHKRSDKSSSDNKNDGDNDDVSNEEAEEEGPH